MNAIDELREELREAWHAGYDERPQDTWGHIARCFDEWASTHRLVDAEDLREGLIGERAAMSGFGPYPNGVQDGLASALNILDALTAKPEGDHMTYTTLQQGIDWLVEKGYAPPDAGSICTEVLGQELCSQIFMSCPARSCLHCPMYASERTEEEQAFLAWAIDALMKAEERIERLRRCENCANNTWFEYVACRDCHDLSDWTEAK